ncbi:cation-translocating P-type ATPase [Christiangramia sediminis]|uniref:Cation-transporting P-type ATPase n=1 Tax=Christiangramia sediminis TaxID=2881336 RepID=A0A9X1LIM8_9FLAO|nr:cation-transporting P-type ATPase [Christiangramia sediminis]MCB7481033.1 cation-transporting P-type ATPase [Christiangramia sediminis]
MVSMLPDAHSLLIKNVLERLQSNSEKGLNASFASERLKLCGENILKRKKAKSVWEIFLEQFLSPIIYILLGAMILAFLFNEIIEGFAILFVVFITVLIGFFMEWQAMRSLVALQKMVETESTVIRDGEERRLASRSLVPGDIILLQAGDVVPADARLIAQKSLSLKESMLTGESEQVEKKLDTLPLETRLTERINMIFNGTIIARGNAKAVVTATGDETAIGQISYMTQEAEKKRTPLEKKLNSLTHWLILFTVVLAVLIAMTGFLTANDPVLMIKTGIALAVAAIPEGLPVVATITLARGMLKLSKQKVVIKRLESVQTLGETNIICTDKTGTLTENKMAVRSIVFENSKIDLENPIDQKNLKTHKNEPDLDQLIKVAVLCNNSNPKKSKANGDAIDTALMEFVNNTSYQANAIAEGYPEVNEMPFDAELKLMLTLNEDHGKFITCVKGAPENVLKYCEYILVAGGEKKLTDAHAWNNCADNLASHGLRVLAFAYRNTTDIPAQEKLLEELVLIGIVGFLDPPRQDIAQAIKIYKDAGIQVKMLTGDHPGTSLKIAQEIGLVGLENVNEKTVLGSDYPDFEKITLKQEKLLLNASVFARMLPKQKLDLVSFYQKHEGVVGMLGDGVNDAPALKKADIGIAMGIRGTEAAKEVADVILMDDKFTALRLAIHQGRAIFENIRYFVIFLVSCNLAEVISVATASLTNLPLPLLPLQILYLNLVTDIFPALALGMGKGSKGIMLNSPRDPQEQILTKDHWLATVIYGLSITIAVIGIVIYANFKLNLPSLTINNMAFYTLVLAQLFNIFNLPSWKTSFFKNEVTSNPWVWISLVVSILITYMGYYIPFLRETLSLVTLDFNQILLVVLFALFSLLISQIVKRLGLVKI